MNFEECKKIMIQYLEGEISQACFRRWVFEYCNECAEKVCHCDECPMCINGHCRFDE